VGWAGVNSRFLWLYLYIGGRILDHFVAISNTWAVCALVSSIIMGISRRESIRYNAVIH